MKRLFKFSNEFYSLNLCKNSNLLHKLKKIIRTDWTGRKSKRIKLSLSSDLFYLVILCYCYALIVTAPVLAHTDKKVSAKSIDINKMSNTSFSNEDKNYNHESANKSVIRTAANSIESNFSTIPKRGLLEAANILDDEEYDDTDLTDDDMHGINKSAKGTHVGASCDESCSLHLYHVICDRLTKTCICDRNHPVLLDILKGCAKPKQLGEQCFYHQTCQYSDENSMCVQVSHNALCQCSPGYHSVTYSKPTKRVFCTEDLAALTSDLPTLLGVTTGIAVLAGLICMVLHLFSKTKYPHHRNFADANIPPPIMYSSDTVQSGRPSSRSSLHSTGSNGSYGNRRPSSAPQPGSKGVLVSTSRTGAARSAAILLISCHISALGDKNGDGESGCDTMTKHLQKQLKYQRQLLHLELPSLKLNNNKNIRNLLGANENEKNDDELNSLDNGCVTVGALPTPASETARFADGGCRPSRSTSNTQNDDLGNQTDSNSANETPSSRRPSVASLHSTSSSIRSYGLMRFEKEAQQKEIRNEMKLRLARLQQQHFPQSRPQIIIGEAISHSTVSKVIIPTPSPLTPNSLDELLPTLDESLEILSCEANDSKRNAAYRGPCSSSSDAI